MSLQRPPAAEPGGGGQQHLQRPFVALAAGQAAMAVGVGIDQAGMHDQAGGVEHLCAVGRGEARAHLADHPILDEDVHRHRAAQRGVGQAATADDLKPWFLRGHAGPFLRRAPAA